MAPANRNRQGARDSRPSKADEPCYIKVSPSLMPQRSAVQPGLTTLAPCTFAPDAEAVPFSKLMNPSFSMSPLSLPLKRDEQSDEVKSEDSTCLNDGSECSEKTKSEDFGADMGLDLAYISLPVADESLPTTVVVHHIPKAHTQELLMKEWPNNGTYDYFYLPMNMNLYRKMPYAFINFTSHAAAVAFMDSWDGQRLASVNRKALRVCWAEIQGRDRNIRQLRKKQVWRIRDKQTQPMIIMDGEQISLVDAFQRVNATNQSNRNSQLDHNNQ